MTASDATAIAAHPAWQTDVGANAVTVIATGAQPADDGLSIVRTVARALWDAGADGQQRALHAGDDAARSALQRWSLLGGPSTSAADPLA